MSFNFWHKVLKIFCCIVIVLLNLTTAYIHSKVSLLYLSLYIYLVKLICIHHATEFTWTKYVPNFSIVEHGKVKKVWSFKHNCTFWPVNFFANFKDWKKYFNRNNIRGNTFLLYFLKTWPTYNQSTADNFENIFAFFWYISIIKVEPEYTK